MGAILFVSAFVLSSLPNIEIVSLLIILFTRHYGKEATVACLVYVALTTLVWGVNFWWVCYWVIWPCFSLAVFKIRKLDNWVIWAIISSLWGLSFGFWFELIYAVIDWRLAISAWIMGIPFDLYHCFGNLMMALLLGKPLDLALERISKQSSSS